VSVYFENCILFTQCLHVEVLQREQQYVNKVYIYIKSLSIYIYIYIYIYREREREREREKIYSKKLREGGVNKTYTVFLVGVIHCVRSLPQPTTQVESTVTVYLRVFTLLMY
jgi:hypothetical protein